MVILEILGGDDGDGEHLGVRHLGQEVAVVVQGFHRGINDLEDGYNPGGVHRFLLRQDPVQQPESCPRVPMNVN
jgi:hypothetical protein